MKFVDILGEAELSDDYRKVSRKVKLMYKTLRTGGFKIGNLLPDMVPFWTGFEIIDDKDVVITYELPTTYHLTSGNQMLAYEVIITGITINCERYPSLADDIDIREDILRKLARKFNNSLKGTFDEGEQIRFSIRKKHNVPSAYENMIDESVNDEQEKQRIINKSKLVYKSFRKGKVKVKVPPIFNNGEQVVVVADYELPKKFKIRLDFNHIFNRPVAFFIPIEDVKIEYDFKAKNDAVQNELLESFRHKIKMRFINFDSNCDMIFTKYKEAFKNTETHVVKEEENKHNHLTKKIPSVYKALRKGTIELTIHQFDYDTIRRQGEEQIKFNYELPNLYKIRIDDYSNNYPVSILVPEIKIDCPEKPELVKQSIKHRILDKLRKKFNHFDLTLFTRPTEFFRKDNGTWTKL
jgi:hypothetical protein